MSNLAEKRERFELLMQQAKIPTDIVQSFFNEGFIEKVECTRANKEWTFYIHKETLIPQDIYRLFCKYIQDKYAHIAKINFVLRFSDQVIDSALVEEYWSVFIDWLQTEMTSVNGWMSRAHMVIVGQIIKVRLLDEHGLEIAKKKNLDQMIVKFFSDFFCRDYKVQFTVNESNSQEHEQFTNQIKEEDRSVAESMMSFLEEPEVYKQDDAKRNLMIGYEIKEKPIPIHQIVDEEKKVTIHGALLHLERKELRNGNALYQFIITDYTDSIQVKVFAKNKQDDKTLKQLSNGLWLRIKGKVEFDRFLSVPELVFIPSDINEIIPPEERMDEAEDKRIEFHLHTKMSAMDGLSTIAEYAATAAKWGHPAIAVTDHGGVQSYPDANYAAKKYGIKMIYGVEANVVNDAIPIVMHPDERNLEEAVYVVFDVETTGLSVSNSKIIEIAGVKIKAGEEIDRFAFFVNPHEKIPYNITQLTNISDAMVQEAPELSEVIPNFLSFIEDCVLVAHNARFDMGFLQEACKKLNLPIVNNAVVDTLELARLLYPTFKNHRLNTLADKLKVNLDQHHRAIDDSISLGFVFGHMIKEAGNRQMISLVNLNQHMGSDLSNIRPFHCCIYARNAMGKKNLFKLISLSHTDYFNKVPCIPKSKLIELREGLIISSGCPKGELYETVLNKSLEEAEETAAFYDILEIQPIEMNMHSVEKGFVASKAYLEEANKKICRIGDKLNIPVIASGNAHYLHPREKICRDITINGITGFSPLKDMKKPNSHLRTTNEMLEEFIYLGKEKAYEVVVKNTQKLADEFESIELFPSQLYTPILDGADDEIRTTCYRTAKEMYGEELPDIVVKRLEKELVPIIKYGFSANYLISEKLVKKSNQDGYLVGSRGSVGSSFVATMLGISEVNPLPAHYICSSCKYQEWFTDGSIPSGFDLPDKDCPTCAKALRGEGQDIPFETFLGFKGDKVPDIDLNFSGDYQPIAHNYTKELFGEKSVFRAGTIGTVADKTAFGYVKKYEEETGKHWRTAEILRLSSGCTGVKRSSGQHPGGIVVVPNYMEVEDITPIQFPADDTKSEWKTTHFDYHAYDSNLLKLDILGHDDPTMMRMLQDLTGVDPTTIPMNDAKVMSIFNSTKALEVQPEKIKTPVGTYGIPEMGTKFVRQMLEETKPSTFADLLQISGLSHGTGVWLGNAQELIKNETCTIKTVIGCRDDIMLYLIYKANMDAGLAFEITESVRKGKGLKDEWIEEMKKHKVPKWYIESCLRIEYMFPKAHAAAYVISAVRTAYFKVYYPIAYYATYFTVRAEDFDIELCCQGYDHILKKLKEIESKGFQATPKEKGMISILEMALEMTARGFVFNTIDLYRSEASKFVIDGESLIPPFSAIQGVGGNAANNIATAKLDGEFLSIEDFQSRSKVTKTVLEILNNMGCFRKLPESNQLSLF